MPTTLNLYGTSTASTTLTTANKLASTIGGTTTTVSNTVGTGTRYSELTAQGSSTWAGLNSIGTPTGKGFLFDVTTLEGQQIVAGTWTPGLRVKISRTGTITADLYMRAYKRSSGGTYTLIGSMHTTGSSITGALTNFAPIAASLSATPFIAGDKLYIDVWTNVTSNTLGFVTMTIDMSLSSTATGIANQVEMDTPGYSTVTTSTKNVLSRLRLSALQSGMNLVTRLQVASLGRAGATNLLTRLLLTLPAKYFSTRFILAALQSGMNLGTRLILLGTNQNLLVRFILAALQSGMNLGTRLLLGYRASGSVLAADSFGRANQVGWGMASDGVSIWSGVTGAATLAISSNKGTATGMTTRTFLSLGSGTMANGEVLARVSGSSTSFSALSVFLRGSGTSGAYTCYHARLATNSSIGGFGIVKIVAGTTTNLVTTTFTTTINTSYWIRFRALGSALYARAWAEGTPEPSTWTLSTTDTSITGTGSYGVGVNTLISADTASFDQVSVSDAMMRRDLLSRFLLQYIPGTIYVQDTFQRSDLFSSWGIASDGNTYTVTGTGTFALSSHKGVLTSPGSTTHANLGSTIIASDAEVLVRFSVGSLSDSVGVELRYSTASGLSSYRLLWYQTALHLNMGVNGSATSFTSSPFSLSTNTLYWMRFRAVGTTLSGRIWPDGTGEPTSWMVTTTDATLTSGGFSLLANTVAGSTGVTFDSFLVSAVNGIASSTLPLRLILRPMSSLDIFSRLRMKAITQADLAFRFLLQVPGKHFLTRLVLLSGQSSVIMSRLRLASYGTGGLSGGTTTTTYDLYPFGGIASVTTVTPGVTTTTYGLYPFGRAVPLPVDGRPNLATRFRLLPLLQRSLSTRLVLLPPVFPITPQSYALAFQTTSPTPSLQNPYGALPLTHKMLRAAWTDQGKSSTPIPLSPYTIGTLNLDMPLEATAPKTQDGLVVPQGSTFTLLFDHVSSATNTLFGQLATGLPLGTGKPVTMSFVLYGGEVVTGSVYVVSTLLTATLWQLSIKTAFPIRVNRWTVSSQFN